VVSALSVRPKKLPSPTWRTFLNSQAKELVALDSFVVPTVTYKVLCVLHMLSHHRASLGPPWEGEGHCPSSGGSPEVPCPGGQAASLCPSCCWHMGES
jgi:hypothetical protein